MENITLQEMLFQSYVEILLGVLLGTALLGKQIKKINLLLTTVIMTIISYYTTGLIGGFRIFGYLINYICVMSLLSGLTVIEVILAAVFSCIINIIVEIFYVPVFFWLTGYTYIDLVYNSWLRIFGYLPQALILLIIIYFLRKHNITIIYWNYKLKLQYYSKENNNDYINQFWILLLAVLLPIIILYSNKISLYEIFTVGLPSEYVTLITTLDTVLVVIFIILSFYSIKKITIFRGIAFIEKNTSEYLNKFVFKSRQSRHDLNNHLQIIYSLLAIKDYDTAKSYFEKTFANIVEQNEFLKLDNNILTALLYAKMGISKSKNISFYLSVKGSFSDFPLQDLDITSIIGNVVDNAIDAVDSDKNNLRKIEVDFIKDNEFFIIKVLNTGSMPNDAIAKNIFRVGFSTKKSTGLGLPTAKTLLEQYNGRIEFINGNDITTFVIYIPVNSSHLTNVV